MPLDSTIADAMLDAMHGPAAGASAAVSFEIGLLDGDPRNGGAELASTGGYARVTGFSNTSSTFWPNASSSGVKTSASVTMPNATDGWSATATWWGWFRTGETTPFIFDALDSPLLVDSAGPVPSFTCSVTFNLAG